MIIVYSHHGNYEFPTGVEFHKATDGQLAVYAKGSHKIALFAEWLHAETYPEFPLGNDE